jgi:hypothetical protein
MKGAAVVRIFCVAVIVVSISVFPISLSPAAAKAKGDIPASVQKSTVSMPVLKGDLWQKMTNDEKVAFIWGAGHVINIEVELMHKIKKLRRDSFVTKAYEGIAGLSMQEIVNRLDEFYKDHPDKLDMPVFDVIWDTMIKPHIKTGIAGWPLKR